MRSVTKTLYEYRTTPYYINHCSHGGYLFSFTCIEKGDGGLVEEKYDAFCFDNAGRQEFCLRFGHEAHEYCSPGSIKNVIQSAPLLARYRALLDILDEVGVIVFQSNSASNTRSEIVKAEMQ